MKLDSFPLKRFRLEDEGLNQGTDNQRKRNDRKNCRSPMWVAHAIEQRETSSLVPYANNARRHDEKNIGRVRASIESFGIVIPILINLRGVIIAGHACYFAALEMELKTIPCIVADHLSEPQAHALRIALNKLAKLSSWDDDALRLEFTDLFELELKGELDFDLDVMGFETAEIDLILEGGTDVGVEETVEEPAADAPRVTQPGDLWQAGSNVVLCGDAQDPASYATVLGSETASMVFTDPPYNVQVQGHVRKGVGNGHREFAMASGEMSDDEFDIFLLTFITYLFANLPEGGVAMICMDWRHVDQLIQTGKAAGFTLINLCVWNKTNGGMGSLYRSKHELICVFKKPGARHVNNVQLGKHGRYRTNVWDYAGVNSFGRGRGADLADHPTVKPTALVADAIKDVSRHGDIVLDPFGGSGSTLLAAAKTGRRARLIELDPLYVDVTIRRWQALTGKVAVHLVTGETFDARARAVATIGNEEARR